MIPHVPQPGKIALRRCHARVQIAESLSYTEPFVNSACASNLHIADCEIGDLICISSADAFIPEEEHFYWCSQPVR